MKLVNAKHSGVFDILYVAYPMIDIVKQIDPIFFGVKRNPNKEYDNLDGFKAEHSSGFGFQSNDTITINALDSVNLGDMFKIGQWE